jgi:hypothetical protein
MNCASMVLLCMLSLAPLYAQSPAPGKLRFDLSRIGFVLDGQQICEDKGRLQDYPSPVMDQIIAGGPSSIPVLIGMLTDGRMAKTKEPIICFWPGMAIGDIAFCVLSDLFTDATDLKGTLPGAGWDDMLGPAGSRPGWEQLHDFTRKHGRAALPMEWRTLWDKYKDQVFWDPKERCFKLKAAK